MQGEMKTQAGRAVRSAAEKKDEAVLPFLEGGDQGVSTLIGQIPR